MQTGIALHGEYRQPSGGNKKDGGPGDYFTINRARQYGKTTTLKALKRYLIKEYIVISLDFQKLSYGDFRTEDFFVRAFSGEVLKKADLKEIMPVNIRSRLQELGVGVKGMEGWQNCLNALANGVKRQLFVRSFFRVFMM